MNLTQAAVAAVALPHGKNDLVVFDDNLSGFGLRLRRGGARTWIYQYKIGSKHRRFTIAKTSALSAAQARKAAAELHAKVKLGLDPAGEKAEGRVRAAETMGAVLDRYLAFKRERLKPRSYIETERHLKKNARALHGLQLAKIDRRAIAARIGAIASNQGAVTANRVRANLSAFFAWCMAEGLLDGNPVIGTNRQVEKSRERVLGDKELKAIWAATSGDDDYSAIVRLLMLTGQRADEIGGLKWTEIVDSQIVLPPARTKNKREHVVPLAPAALAILNNRQRNGDAFVFGRRQGKGFRGWSVSKEALDERLGEQLEHWTHHDLRRTLSTRMHDDLGIAPHIVEACLNHVSGHKRGVAGTYNRAAYLREKRIAFEKYADYVLAAGEGQKSTGEVINFPA
jgi:integrase